MDIYLSIDDTDNLDSPGSGHLAELMANTLQHHGLTSQCLNITRHQLLVHESIPYTSHNSSMCFPAVIDEDNLLNVIQFAKEFLKNSSAPGSDPGLCVAVESETLVRQAQLGASYRVPCLCSWAGSPHRAKSNQQPVPSVARSAEPERLAGEQRS